MRFEYIGNKYKFNSNNWRVTKYYSRVNELLSIRYYESGNREKSKKFLDSAVYIARLAEKKSPKDEYAELVTFSLRESNVARLVKLGRYDSAKNELLTIWQAIKKIRDDNPENDIYLNALAQYADSMATIEAVHNNGRLNLKYREKAIDALQLLLKRNPYHKGLLSALSDNLLKSAKINMLIGKAKLALEQSRVGLIHRRYIHKFDPTNNARRRNLASALTSYGEILVGTGRLEKSGKVFSEQLKITKAVYDSEPDYPLNKRDYSTSLWWVGWEQEHSGNWRDAVSSYVSSLKHRFELLDFDKSSALDASKTLQLLYRTCKKGCFETKEFILGNLLEKMNTHLDKEKLPILGSEYSAVLSALAWESLLRKKFVSALERARKSVNFSPGIVELELTHAHALLLTNKKTSMHIYEKFRNTRLSNGKLWENVVIADFAYFRKKGITHPQMIEIESLFKK